MLPPPLLTLILKSLELACRLTLSFLLLTCGLYHLVGWEGRGEKVRNPFRQFPQVPTQQL